MKSYNIFCFMALALYMICPQDSYGQEKDSTRWQFKVSPYLYVPSFYATLNFRQISGIEDVIVEVKPEDYLERLKLAFMLAMEARKNRYSICADIFYFRLSGENSYIKSVKFQIDNPISILPPIDVGIDVDAGTLMDMRSTQYTLVGGYALKEGKSRFMLISGLRVIHVSSSLDWKLNSEVNGPDGLVLDSSGTLSSTTTSWNAIIGLKGNMGLGHSEKLRMFYYVDAGLGSAKFTWQAIAGLDYYFTDTFAAKLMYRHIDYISDGSNLIDKVAFSGVAVGAAFNF